ncbi:glycosyltransferase [archaeon]|nr:glycosyltransferase [archaeon]MBT6761638.1 glycosyltransferase [archaeon]
MNRKYNSVEISVIIPALNEENYILKTLQSLAHQSFKKFEIIVVLSACTDRTEQVVQRFIKLRPELQISLITEHDIGVSRARNRGAKFAKGNLLFFLDADTTLDHNCLFKASRYMTEKNSVGTCHSKPEPWSLMFSMLIGFKNMFHRTGLVKGVHGTLLCWRGHFETVQGFNESLIVMEHYDLIKRLLEHGAYIWIPTAFAKTSMRRWQHKGIFALFYFWLVQGLKKFMGKDTLKYYEAVR